MPQPITVDGRTLLASYEHASRVLEVAGIPIAGWNKLTGGGTSRENQNYVWGAGDEPRGLTDGRVVPQDYTLAIETLTFEGLLRPALAAQALLTGDTTETAYQKVPFTIVDQWVAKELGQPSLTIRSTVKIGGDKPMTENDGTQFGYELTLKQVGVPKRSYV